MSRPRTWKIAASLGVTLLAGVQLLTASPVYADEGDQQVSAQRMDIPTVYESGSLDATVTIQGFVTGIYTDQGIGGFYVQKEGTGGSPDPNVMTSQAVRVTGAQGVNEGDYVSVSGVVKNDDAGRVIQTQGDQLTWVASPDGAKKPEPITSLSSIKGTWSDASSLERIAGMLVRPDEQFSVAGLDQYGTRGEAIIAEKSKASQDERAASGEPGTVLMLDDGAADEYVANGDTQKRVLPRWAGKGVPRIGSAVDFTGPSVLQFAQGHSGQSDGWHFQPLKPMTDGADVLPARAKGSRVAADVTAPDGDLRIGQVDLGNYFPSSPESVPGAGEANCTARATAAGVKLAILGGGGCPVLGAADSFSFERQRSKVAALLTGLKGVDVIAVQGLQNDAQMGAESSTADSLAQLLNTSGGEEWKAISAPQGAVGPRSNAILYRSDRAKPQGDPALSSDKAFYSASSPVAQTFTTNARGRASVTIVSTRFSGQASSDYDGDLGLNQLAGTNAEQRTQQAGALKSWLQTLPGRSSMVVSGNLGSGDAEEAVSTVKSAGLKDLVEGTDIPTTQGSDTSANLTHLFVSVAIDKAGSSSAKVWGVSAQSAAAKGYANYGMNASNLVDPASPERATYENPVVAGVKLPAVAQLARGPEKSSESRVAATQSPESEAAAKQGDGTARSGKDSRSTGPQTGSSSSGGMAPKSGGVQSPPRTGQSQTKPTTAPAPQSGPASNSAARSSGSASKPQRSAEQDSATQTRTNPAQAIQVGQDTQAESASASLNSVSGNGPVRLALIALALALAVGATISIVMHRRRNS